MGARTVLAFAPGRVELLGNHTDYNEGVVLGAAIERGLTVRGEARSDNRIALTSATLGKFETDARGLRPLPGKHWANYVLGVAAELDLAAPGFAIEISGDLPAGCGLSSSAALQLATRGRRRTLRRAPQRVARKFAGEFENSIPELDELVRRAQRLSGVLGARLTGARFGGAIVVLCRENRAPRSRVNWAHPPRPTRLR